MDATTASLTLHQLRELYLHHARIHYRRRSGDPTREAENMAAAIDRYINFAGEASMGLRINRHQTRAWVDQLAAEGLTRGYVNQCLKRVRRWVRWCADWEYIPFSITEDLRLVRPLVPFRSAARESKPIPPPPISDILAVIELLPPLPRDVLILARLTAARPSELLELTNGEVVVDESGPRLLPVQHKTAHHGHKRVIPLTPAAWAIVDPRWKPLLPSERLFESARRSRSGHYSISAFRSNLKRACHKAGVAPFTPYAVRHAIARHVRREAGLDAAQALLGHASAKTTEIYAPLTAGEAMTLLAARRATEVL